MENLLAADDISPDLIYGPAFPRKTNDWGTNVNARLSEQASWLRRTGLPCAASSYSKRSAILRPSAGSGPGAFEKLQMPTATFLEPIARLATSTAKTVREAASSLIIRAGEEALPALRALAESGKADARGHALRLIAEAGLGREQGLPERTCQRRDPARGQEGPVRAGGPGEGRRGRLM